MLVVDSHCHLDYEGLAERPAGVLARAEAAGVGLMLIDRHARQDSSTACSRIAEENANVFCTVGTHPHHAHEEPDVTAENWSNSRRHPESGRHRRGGARLSL